MKQTKIEADYYLQLLHCINLEILIDKKSLLKSAKALALGHAGPRRPRETKLLQCVSPLVAQSGHPGRAQQCPLSGVKRT
jgi:hypothetical protein